MSSTYLLTALSIVGFIACFTAARRGRRQLSATAIAVLALLGLALAPLPDHYSGTELLLTDGATTADLAREGLTLEPSGGVYALGNDPSWPRWVERLSDSGPLVRADRGGRPLTIAGHGLDPWDVERLTGSGLFEISRAAAPPPPNGVGRVSWRRDLVVGQSLSVTGTVVAAPEGPALVRLGGPGGSVQQTFDAAQTEVPFFLELLPPGPGRFLFSLELELPDGSEWAAPVDVHVAEASPPALLWLERAPSFETRYVKQWLADTGGSLAVRTTVSRDRSRYEHHNRQPTDLSRLTLDRLEPFDVVVTDSITWADLPRSEREAIEQAVRAGELGLVLRLMLDRGTVDEPPFGAVLRRVGDLDELMVRPAMFDDPPDPIGVPPFELEGAGEPLFEDRAGRVLAMRRDLGRGATAVTTLADSFRWVLEGRPDVHRGYWLSLLEAVAPPTGQHRWLIPTGPILQHEPLRLILAGDASQAAYLVEPDGSRAELPLRQHPTRPDRLSVTLWPRLTGWHRLEVGGSIAEFHSVARPDWVAWRMTRRRDATALAARGSTSTITPAVPAPPWQRLLALTVLVAALAYAWIDERRSAA